MHDIYSSIRHRPDRDALEMSLRGIRRSSGQFPAFIGRVVAKPVLPTALNLYFSVNPVAVLGIEAEGNSATLVPDTTTTVLVSVLGTKVPALGDDLVCRYIENRWVAERYGNRSQGGGGASILGCACVSIPTTLRMNAAGPCDGVFQPCILQYGPTPSNLSSLNLGANSFLSTTSFVDDFSGVRYLYNLECDTIFFRLSRVYLPSAFGGAFHDASIYSWSIGQPGNTCSPFLLSTGYIYSGGNSNCIVTIST